MRTPARIFTRPVSKPRTTDTFSTLFLPFRTPHSAIRIGTSSAGLGLLGIIGLLLAGCAVNPTHRYSGHWVQGEPYSNFIDSRDGRTYLLYDPLPKDVEDYMESQKGYSVPNSESGMESAIHLVVEATMADEHTYDPEATPAGTELHVTKVISYGPADPAFVEGRKNAAQ